MGEGPNKPKDASGASSPHDPMQWPLAAMKFATDAMFWWLEQAGERKAPDDRPPLAWTTPNKVALELTTMRLRDFSRGSRGQPVLICGPYALHSTLIADFAPGHSIVERLQQSGHDRIFLTDWCSASADMRFLAIDQYLADLNVAVDEIGAPVDLIGLCQGGWLSLVYAARFPGKVRRLVLAGTPVDVSVDSGLVQLVRSAPQAAFEGIVESGGGIVKGAHILRFWNRASDTALVLQRSLSQEAPGDVELHERFARWHDETVDLPGTYYLQVVHWIYRENRITNGTFVALGRTVSPADVRVPVFLLGRRRRNRPGAAGHGNRFASGHGSAADRARHRPLQPPRPFSGRPDAGHGLAPDCRLAAGGQGGSAGRQALISGRHGTGVRAASGSQNEDFRHD